MAISVQSMIFDDFRLFVIHMWWECATLLTAKQLIDEYNIFDRARIGVLWISRFMTTVWVYGNICGMALTLTRLMIRTEVEQMVCHIKKTEIGKCLRYDSRVESLYE